MGQKAFYKDEGKGFNAVTSCITAVLRRGHEVSTRLVGTQDTADDHGPGGLGKHPRVIVLLK